MKVEIKNGHVVDPASGRDERANVYIAAGRVVGIGDPPSEWHATRTIDATGLVVCPGLVDLSARIGNPSARGGIHAESELRAAVHGGVTSVVVPPDTNPVLDEPGLVEMMKTRAHALGLAHVLPLGALTSGLKGEALAEMSALFHAGCVGFGQADQPVQNTLVLLRAMSYAATLGYRVWLRPQEPWLSAAGIVHDGEVATRMGLPGQPAIAESIAVAQLLRLAQEAGCSLHLCRISTAESVDLIREAKRAGQAVSCDVSAAHVHLCDVDIGYFDTAYRVDPPLRSHADRAALRAGLADGTIDAIVSDHTPVSVEAKQLPFAEAKPGMTAVETLLSLVLKWAASESIALPSALATVTSKAAAIAQVPNGRLSVGNAADICVFDPTAHRVLTPAGLQSAGKNSPFIGYELPGLVRFTLVGGRVVYEATGRV